MKHLGMSVYFLNKDMWMENFSQAAELNVPQIYYMW